MPIRLAVLGLAVCLCASPQMKMTVAQLVSFVRSSVELQHQDKKVAEYVRKVQLSHRLTESAVEDLQGLGAGPKTMEALRELRDATKGLDAPPVAAPKPKPKPIPEPSAAERKRIIGEVREYGLNYSKRLPDFICTQVTRRYVDPSGLEFWQRADVVTAKLSYFEQREDYKVILVNNRPTDISYDQLGGATSTGEFGSMMREIFESSSNTRFQWERWATLRGQRAHVFRYRVPKVSSKWRISYEKTMDIVPGYSGLIYVDAATLMVMRITLEADDIPPSFPIQQASTMLDYNMVEISGQEFMLPLRAMMRMRQGKILVKNEVEFRMYRKFGAEAVITFDTPDPLPEEQVTEQPPQP